jgi:hypothetical protein
MGSKVSMSKGGSGGGGTMGGSLLVPKLRLGTPCRAKLHFAGGRGA